MMASYTRDATTWGAEIKWATWDCGSDKFRNSCDGVDFATQDLAIALLTDEQEHRRQFVGYLKEYEKQN